MIVMHQAARMIWLADRIEDVARGRPAVQILFFLIAAEAVAKLIAGFDGEGKSRQFVHKFFGELCSDDHRARLGRAIGDPGTFFSVSGTVNYLYDIRCSVVHEGRYFDVHLRDHGTPTINVTKNGRSVVVYMSTAELRQIVLEGVVLSCERLLPSRQVDSAGQDRGVD